MKLRLFNLNIEKGRFLDRVITFIKKNQFDIVLLQEVTGGILQQDGLDCFEELLTRLAYKGELGIYFRQKNRPDTFVGNAIFYRPDFKLIKLEKIWLRDFYETDDALAVSWDKAPRNALSLVLNINETKVTFVSTHLPWSLTSGDTPEKVSAGVKLIRYIKKIKTPFVLAGDFNVDIYSIIIKELSNLARNLTAEAGITNTLDLKVHKAKKLLPPLGLAVDFVFVSPVIKDAKTTLVSEERLADHLGQIIEIDV